MAFKKDKSFDARGYAVSPAGYELEEVKTYIRK